jgi:two-component system, OmpR family, response regulator
MTEHLLLAEDDAVSRAFLHEALNGAGYRVAVAEDGATALELARATRYAGLLLDVNLPRLRGPALLAALRRDPAAASQASPALALTAEPGAALSTELATTGFKATLGKPIGIDALRRAVADLLAGVAIRVEAGTACADPARDWDEPRALAAANGDQRIMATLRAMLLADLPQQRARVIAALARVDPAAAAGELHRLRAASGICGAMRLAAAVDALAAALQVGDETGSAYAEFERASGRLLEEQMRSDLPRVMEQREATD